MQSQVQVLVDKNGPPIPGSDFFESGTQPELPVSEKDAIRYEGVVNIDHDVDLAFKLRGINYNPLVDAANPLISLVLSVKKLSSVDNVQELYHRVRDETVVILEEIKSRDYDGSTQLSYRYCLCSFIDEVMMGTAWGGQSIWATQSLLAHFHNETWGGEKFFDILSRAMMEPEKYKDLLEFLYICLSLGFKGRYSRVDHGSEKIQELLVRLNLLLREQRGEVPETILNKVDIEKVGYSFRPSFPLWGVWLTAGLILIGAFIYYAVSLDSYSDQILLSIDEILEKWSVD